MNTALKIILVLVVILAWYNEGQLIWVHYVNDILKEDIKKANKRVFYYFNLLLWPIMFVISMTTMLVIIVNKILRFIFKIKNKTEDIPKQEAEVVTEETPIEENNND